jgi:hypothetical protein
MLRVCVFAFIVHKLQTKLINSPETVRFLVVGYFIVHQVSQNSHSINIPSALRRIHPRAHVRVFSPLVTEHILPVSCMNIFLVLGFEFMQKVGEVP